MDIPAGGNKSLFVGIAVVVILGFLAYFMLSGAGNAPTLRAYFEPSSSVRAGGNATLVVEVVNTLGADVRTLTVSAAAVDPYSVAIVDSPQSQPNVGKGELRKFRFPARIGEAREGTYSVTVTVDLDGKLFEVRAGLEVRGS